jgi:hypothetical protein
MISIVQMEMLTVTVSVPPKKPLAMIAMELP